MPNREVLEAFFRAENERDWEVYKQYLHPEISWELFSKEKKHIIGVENYMQTIINAYNNNDAQFVCLEMHISNDGNRIVANLLNNSGIRSLDIFDFKEGKIYREYEFILDF